MQKACQRGQNQEVRDKKEKEQKGDNGEADKEMESNNDKKKEKGQGVRKIHGERELEIDVAKRTESKRHCPSPGCVEEKATWMEAQRRATSLHC